MAGSPNDVHSRPIGGSPKDVHPASLAEPPPHAVFNGPHEELFDWQKVRRLAMFSIKSVRRRPVLFLIVWGGMVLLAAVGLKVMPKTYEVQSSLLAQKNPVLASHGDANQMDQPTRGAAELIIRTDNLHALIEQTNLLQEWPKRRAPILRLKDWLMLKVKGRTSQQEMLQNLTGLLSKNLMAWTTSDGTVNLKLVWPDGLMAYRLVDAANQNFLEERHVLEVSTISEEVSILEVHAAHLHEEIDRQVAEVQRLRERSTGRRTRAPQPRPSPALAISASTDPEVVNLRVMLDSRRRAIADLEEMRRRHALELQTRLTEQRAIYSESHPILMDLQQSIASLKAESPQLVALRQEEAELRQKLAKYSSQGEISTSPAMPVIPPDLFRFDSEDPLVDYARQQLRFTIQQYASMRERINAARIDLDTAQAAFKYRYSVLQVPEVPRGPIKPKAILVMAAAVVVGLLLALFATTGADLRSDLVLETWQLETAIGPGLNIIEVRLS